jgi:hypothetical protein
MQAIEHVEKQRNCDQRDERRIAECYVHSRASP